MPARTSFDGRPSRFWRREAARVAAVSSNLVPWILCALVACSSDPKPVVDDEPTTGMQTDATAQRPSAMAAHDGGSPIADMHAERGGTGVSAAGRSGSAPSSSQPSAAGRGGATGSVDMGAPEPADDAGAAGGEMDAAATPTAPERSRDPGAPDDVILPDETADDEALGRLATWDALPRFGRARYEQQSSHDRGQANIAETTLFPMFDDGNRDLNNFICKSANAVTAASLLAYHYDQEACPDAYVRGVVLARYEGSGALARFWLTASSLSTEGGALQDEMLRVYVDDNPRPLIQVRLADVLSGAAGEIFAPPFGAASKAFVAWYYPVVFGSKLVVVLDRLRSEYYFQTDVLLDPEPKPRFAPAKRLAARDAALMQLKAAAPAADTMSLTSESFTLAKGETRTVTTQGPATVRELRLKAASDQLSALAGVRLRARWNGQDTAAIDVPILDLFASRRSIVAKSNLALAASNDNGTQVLSLRLPMPFETNAEWTLTQTSDATAKLDLEWLGVRSTLQGEFGHLYVQARELPLPAMEVEQTVADAKGRGRFVGLCADLEGRPDPAYGLLGGPLNLLEGDVRATIDGKLALDGTGTEDYPDNSFYFRDTPAATPFAQNWALVNEMGASPRGGVSFCRWQVLGTEVDFQSELRVTHEIAAADPSIVFLHRTIAFLYLP